MVSGSIRWLPYTVTRWITTTSWARAPMLASRVNASKPNAAACRNTPVFENLTTLGNRPCIFCWESGRKLINGDARDRSQRLLKPVAASKAGP